MKTVIFGACSDLGVHINGTHLGPDRLIETIKEVYKGRIIKLYQDDKFIKSKGFTDKRKNEEEISKYNSSLYNTILENSSKDELQVLIGGDHSVAVASALASAKKHGNIGIIWFDAHTDYNTFETTLSGNIHGLPLATINGYKTEELRDFHDGNIISPVKTVIVGARSIDKLEKNNLIDAGVTVFTTEDIKVHGVEKIVEEAFKIASKDTLGVHVSYDLDLIDPAVAPGVSIPEINGLSKEEALKVNECIINNLDKVVSYDLVEFNPLRDKSSKTERLALELLKQVLDAAEEKVR